MLRTNSGLIFGNPLTETPGMSNTQNFEEFEKVNNQHMRSGDYEQLIKKFESAVEKVNINDAKRLEVPMTSGD